MPKHTAKSICSTLLALCLMLGLTTHPAQGAALTAGDPAAAQDESLSDPGDTESTLDPDPVETTDPANLPEPGEGLPDEEDEEEGDDSDNTAQSIELNVSSLSTMYKGETKQLVATVHPADAAQEVTWRSSSPAVLSVDEHGVVTAIKTGSALIIATSADGAATRTVTVRVAAGSGPSTASPKPSGRTRPDGVAIPEGAVRTTSPHSGRSFIFNLRNLYLAADHATAYLDKYAFELAVPAAPVGDDLSVALSDLAKIYGPDFAVRENGGAVTIEHAGLSATIRENDAVVDGPMGRFTMAAAPTVRDGELCVPALELMEGAFGKYRSENSGVYAISNYSDGDISGSNSLHAGDLSVVRLHMRGAKEHGIVSIAYYFEPADKVLTSQLYVPTTLYRDPGAPMRAMVVFPGANGNADSYDNFSTHRNPLQYYAERSGYVLITVESYIYGGQYGEYTGPLGRFPVTNPDNPDNPWDKEQAWLDEITLSGQAVIANLDLVLERYPSIDQDSVYAFGVSMGSMGAFSMGMYYNDRFRALVGTAGLIEADWAPIENIGDTPFLFVCGTEDSNGLDYFLEYAVKLENALPGFEMVFVGGAPHGGEWYWEADYIFDWLETH